MEPIKTRPETVMLAEQLVMAIQAEIMETLPHCGAREFEDLKALAALAEMLERLEE